MTDRTLTTTEFAVLGLLTRGERSGYALRKHARASVGYFWSPARSQIYAVLPRLVEGGYVTRRDVVQHGKPDKQLYRITALGERALRDWLESRAPEPVADRNPLLLKVFFGDLASSEAILDQVRDRRREAERLHEELDAIEAGVEPSERDLYPRLTRRYGRRYADMLIAWADEVEHELAAAEPTARKAAR